MATNVERMNMAEQSDWASTLENVGANVTRYSLVIILLWVGALKFTAYEAEGIQGLIANSPLMSWMYSVMSVRAASMVIGTFEILCGLLIATRPFAPTFSSVDAQSDCSAIFIRSTLVAILILLLAAEKSADGVFVHFRPLLLAASFEFPKRNFFLKMFPLLRPVKLIKSSRFALRFRFHTHFVRHIFNHFQVHL